MCDGDEFHPHWIQVQATAPEVSYHPWGLDCHGIPNYDEARHCFSSLIGDLISRRFLHSLLLLLFYLVHHHDDDVKQKNLTLVDHLDCSADSWTKNDHSLHDAQEIMPAD